MQTVTHMMHKDPNVVVEISITTRIDPETQKTEPALFIRYIQWPYAGYPSDEQMRNAVYEVFEQGNPARHWPIIPAYMRFNK